MTDYKILSDTDRTSWTRVMMVARYYYPRLKRQIIIYPLISLLLFPLSWTLWKAGMPVGYQMVLNIIEWMIILGPIAFALCNSPEMSLSLPANGCEKGIFCMAYTFIAIPLLAGFPCWLFSALTGANVDVTEMFTETGVTMSADNIRVVKTMGFFSSMAQMATCLWFVMASRHNRVLYGVLGTIGVGFVLGIISGFTGVIIGMRDGFAGVDPANPQQILDQVVDYIGYTLYLIIPWLVISLVMGWRAITRRQI